MNVKQQRCTRKQLKRDCFVFVIVIVVILTKAVDSNGRNNLWNITINCWYISMSISIKLDRNPVQNWWRSLDCAPTGWTVVWCFGGETNRQQTNVCKTRKFYFFFSFFLAAKAALIALVFRKQSAVLDDDDVDEEKNEGIKKKLKLLKEINTSNGREGGREWKGVSEWKREK